MPRVDDTWPQYWVDVEAETLAAGSSVADYLAQDHSHVVSWFERHWEMLETLVDDPDLDHVRFATFDGDQLAYRFRVIAIHGGGSVRLIESKVLN